MTKKAIISILCLLAFLFVAWFAFFRDGGVTLAPFLPAREDTTKLLTQEKSPFTLPNGFHVALFTNIPGARVDCTYAARAWRWTACERDGGGENLSCARYK